MKSGLNFLVAARQCEIVELERLARTCELAGRIGRLVHALQRERGVSSLYLGSQGERSGDQLARQRLASDARQQEVLAWFDGLETEAGRMPNGARLFARIAVAIQGLQMLPATRLRIDRLQPGTAEATAAYSRLIAQLLAAVFEAADNAGDPEISRALVAMFSFMQGKEFAGQERAFGSAVFASGRVEASTRHDWQHLIDLQHGSLQVFLDFCDPGVLAIEHASHDAELAGEIERLRRVGWAPPTPHEAGAMLGQTWYEACTRRLDAMRTVEDALAANLRRVCERRMAQAREELRDQQALLAELDRRQSEAPPNAPPSHYGPNLERSIVTMVQDQSRRLQAMSDELDAVKSTLNERKLVERAKGLLMAHRQLTEEEAHKMLRTTAMNQNRRLVDVAEAILTTADVLPGRTR
ncbi:MAG TPA: nitrate- and nitrite sensing domain-containing protein [Ramlibacter sp.]|uniref:nitrate- and nitrite sensing domain-containing protein n=1 Tax=Ramlibacter sp. TaxID=1917967 RepID=UPI002D056E76|nr:nitrate- and nitrite sensing domain-containing protein [Ramlibacter sp.]HVZ42941.1 nitrate- and nitrite sensing domain-containing protein [Ramlibacter sp.]